jgi:hypothetical protein
MRAIGVADADFVAADLSDDSQNQSNSTDAALLAG